MSDITNLPLSGGHQVPEMQHAVSESIGSPREEGSLAAGHPVPSARLGEQQPGSDIDLACGRDTVGEAAPSLTALKPPARIEEQPTGLPEYFDRARAQVAGLGMFDPEQMRRMRSDIVVVTRLTKIPLDRLPCDPCLLRPLLQRVLPARHPHQ